MHTYMTFQDMQKLAVILCPEYNIFVLVVIRVYACMCVYNVIVYMTAYFWKSEDNFGSWFSYPGF